MSVHHHQPSFGSLLRAYRVDAGLSQEALADRSGVSLRTIQQVESDRAQPRRATRSLLADALRLAGPDRDAFLRSLPLATRRRSPRDASGVEGVLPTDIRSLVPLPANDASETGGDRVRLIEAYLRPSPTRIPRPVSSLLGREGDLAAIRRLIDVDHRRLVTLLGVGGSGKTRLAIQAAHEVLGSFVDGVWFVDLAPMHDPGLLSRTVAGVLGVHEVLDTPLQDTLRGFLARKHALLVLDNCEHLVDACATLVHDLLISCPSLTILATSREPLRLDGEQRRQVRPLAAPDPANVLAVDALAEFDAVHLFVERARAISDAFELTDQNAASVAQLCARLEGIPLAIELAASRMGMLTVEQIVARLDDTFRLLVSTTRARPTRQQTMGAALDWSYDLLDEGERVAFSMLSTFAGTFDLEAISAVCVGDGLAGADAVDVVSRLMDKSLVTVQETSVGRRYRLLEPVRQYAHRRLAETGLEAATRGRHAAYYATVADRVSPLLRGPSQITWLDRLEVERDNLRGALGWVVEHGDLDLGLRLAARITPYWEARGYLSEGRQWLERLLAAPGCRPAARDARMDGLVAAGRLAFWQVDHARAETCLTEALKIARALSATRTAGEVLGWLSAVHWQQHGAERGVALAEESLGLGRALADEALTAFAQLNLGIAFHHLRDMQGAVPVLEEALATYRRLGDIRFAAIAATCLAWTTLEAGDHVRAAAVLHESMRGLLEVRDQRFIAIALRCLVRIARARGELQRAVQLFGVSEALRMSLGLRRTPHAATNDQKLRASLEGQMSAREFDEAFASGAAMNVDHLLDETGRWT